MYHYLSDFGTNKLFELIQILEAWRSNGLPDDFYDDDVVPMFNRNSGNVFLINSDYQVAMEVNSVLKSWYFTPYAGHEGFLEDLAEDYRDNPDDWDEGDVENLRDLGTDI